MNMDKIAADAGAVLKLLAPVLAAEVPPAAGALGIAAKIGDMVLAEAPEAIAIYHAVMSGGLLTPADLAAIYADEDSADAALHAAIAAKLAEA